MQQSRVNRFKKTSVTPSNEINIDSDTLKLYLAIDKNKTIVEIFRETQLERSVFKASLVKLYKLKLIEQVAEAVEYIEIEFINKVRENLIKVSGPLGEILLEEAVEDMNCEISQVPKSKIADLVYNIANDIPSEKQAAEFKKIMMQEIKILES